MGKNDGIVTLARRQVTRSGIGYLARSSGMVGSAGIWPLTIMAFTCCLYASEFASEMEFAEYSCNASTTREGLSSDVKISVCWAQLHSQQCRRKRNAAISVVFTTSVIIIVNKDIVRGC